MKTLILDQSSTCTGYAYLDGNTLDDHGIFKPFGISFLDRALSFLTDLRILLKEYRPHELVVEDTKYMKQRSADTARAMSNILFLCEVAAREARIPMYKQNPMTIKKIVTNDGKADKSKIALAVQNYFNFKAEDLIDDNHSDALAGAISWMVNAERIRRV